MYKSANIGANKINLQNETISYDEQQKKDELLKDVLKIIKNCWKMINIPSKSY